MYKVGVTRPSVGESEQENVAVSMIEAFWAELDPRIGTV